MGGTPIPKITMEVHTDKCNPLDILITDIHLGVRDTRVRCWPVVEKLRGPTPGWGPTPAATPVERMTCCLLVCLCLLGALRVRRLSEVGMDVTYVQDEMNAGDQSGPSCFLTSSTWEQADLGYLWTWTESSAERVVWLVAHIYASIKSKPNQTS